MATVGNTSGQDKAPTLGASNAPFDDLTAVENSAELGDETPQDHQGQNETFEDHSDDAPRRDASSTQRMLQRLEPHNKPGNKESSYITQCENAQLQAKVEELEKLKQHDVYETVDDIGQQAISCRWIMTEKENKI